MLPFKLYLNSSPALANKMANKWEMEVFLFILVSSRSRAHVGCCRLFIAGRLDPVCSSYLFNLIRLAEPRPLCFHTALMETTSLASYLKATFNLRCKMSSTLSVVSQHFSLRCLLCHHISELWFLYCYFVFFCLQVNCNGFTIEDEELSHLGSAVFPE